MNEVPGINLEQLNLTEAERQELSSALALLESHSGQDITEAVLQKYFDKQAGSVSP
jgi:hypothetical protein